MSPIVTLTFNPAIDKSTTIPYLVPEKKLHCTEPLFEPGGGGINVARAIHKLSGETTAIYLAGGYSGQFFNDLLSKERIKSIAIPIENPTRENLIMFDQSSHQQYRFGMPGPHVSEKEGQKCLDTLRKISMDFLVCSGSLSPAIFTDIAAIAQEKGAKLIVDTSGEALRFAASAGTYLLKPNLKELSALARHEGELPIMSIVPAAQKIVYEYGVEAIVVSLGSSGAILITKHETLQIHVPQVRIKSTVGAGDSMVAGIVLGLSKGKTLSDAVQYGVACGTAATLNPGTALCKLEDTERLYEEISNADKGISFLGVASYESHYI